MTDNNKAEQARALLDCNGEVWALARSGDDEYSNRYRFNRTRAELEENFGPLAELWPRETPEPGDRSEALTTLLDSYHIGSGCSMELGRYRITQDPEPEPEMVTATYPGDTWEKDILRVAAMDGATGRCERKGAVATGPVSVRSSNGIFLGDWPYFPEVDGLSTLTVTAPKPVEPERPEWADALVVRVDGAIYARMPDGWAEVGPEAYVGYFNADDIADLGPGTVVVDAAGRVES